MSSGAMAEPASEASQPVDLNQHPSGLIPIIQNVVATVNLSCKVNTKDIDMKARNAECPPRLPAVILRIREPKTTALIFPTGKMVCTGAKSEELAKVASRKFARIVQKVGYDVEFKDFKVQNLVATCSMPFLISLERLSCSAHSASGFTRYEPELFPGLIYHMKKPKVVLLIFISGKVVITGAKVKGDLDKAFQNIYPVLREYERVWIGI